MQISTGLALRSWKGFLSIFFSCHPAESILAQMKQAGWSVVFIVQIFSLSHILGVTDRVGITRSPVSALNYAHPRVSETTRT